MKIFICVVVIILGVLISLFHMTYTADYIARFVGYFVALGVLPFIYGGLLGYIGVSLLKKKVVRGFKYLWWIPLLGSMSALAPIVLVLWIMSQPEM